MKSREKTKLIKIGIISITIIVISFTLTRILSTSSGERKEIVELIEGHKKSLQLRDSLFSIELKKLLSETKKDTIIYNITYSEKFENVKAKKNVKSYWLVNYQSSTFRGFSTHVCSGYNFKLLSTILEFKKYHKLKKTDYFEIDNFQRLTFEEYLKYENSGLKKRGK